METGAFILGEDALFPIDNQPFEKGEVGFQDGPEIDGFAGKEGFPGGNGIEDEPEGDLPKPLLGRQAFGHHDEIIAKIEKDLAFVTLWQGSATYMVDDRRRAGINAVPGQLHAPAEIDLFLVGEEEVLQAMQFVVQTAADKERGAAGPEDGFDLVILPIVYFTDIEDPTLRKGIAKIIEPAAGGAGIFERLAVGRHPDLWLAGADGGVGFHQFYEGFQPAGAYLNIGIEEDIVVAVYLPQRLVVAAREAAVLVHGNDAEGGVVFFHKGDGVICRGVVGHDDLGARAGADRHKREELFEIFAPVEIEYDYGCCWRHAFKYTGYGGPSGAQK